MSGGKASENELGMSLRKPSDHLDVMVLPATLASLTLSKNVINARQHNFRAVALLSTREQSAATLIAATVRLHQARRDPTASRSRQEAYPVSAFAASSSTAAAAAAAPTSALLLAPPPRFWRRSSRQHLELGVSVATSPLRGVRLLWRCLPGGGGRQAAQLPPPMTEIDLRPIPPIYSPRAPRSAPAPAPSPPPPPPPSPSRPGDSFARAMAKVRVSSLGEGEGYLTWLGL